MKRIPCADASILLRFLPYADRAPYPTRRTQGRYEECYASAGDARKRFRELRQQRRIEDAEIIREVRDKQGGKGYVKELEWRDRLPQKLHKRRR